MWLCPRDPLCGVLTRSWYSTCCLYLKDRSFPVVSMSVHPCHNPGDTRPGHCRLRVRPVIWQWPVPTREGSGAHRRHMGRKPEAARPQHRCPAMSPRGPPDVDEQIPCSDPTLTRRSPGASAITSRTGTSAAGSEGPFLLMGRVT